LKVFKENKEVWNKKDHYLTKGEKHNYVYALIAETGFSIVSHSNEVNSL
jgi:hypothetical protein